MLPAVFPPMIGRRGGSVSACAEFTPPLVGRKQWPALHRHGQHARLRFLPVIQARYRRGACQLAMHHDGNGLASLARSHER